MGSPYLVKGLFVDRDLELLVGVQVRARSRVLS